MIYLGLASYINGNYLVSRYSRGDMKKRCLRIDEDFKPDFPDSIDLKISNRCSLGCPYCHENSVKTGGLAKIDEIKKHLSSLPEKPIEIAIGGGDLVEDEESLLLLSELVSWLDSRKNLIGITLNEKSISVKTISSLKNIFKNNKFEWSLGISLGPDITEKRLEELSKILFETNLIFFNPKLVFHIILGLFPKELLKDIVTKRSLLGGAYNYNRILFLGYKQYGRAKNTELPPDIKSFEIMIKEAILNSRGDCVYNIFGFDNLAIDQLNLSKAFLSKDFDRIYQGPEFSCSMYVDAVLGQFAKSSTSDERVDWNSVDILDYFKHDKN